MGMISRISVSRKLLLIYALDMIAVIFLGFSLAEEKYIAINFARKELAGTAYIDAARDALFVIADNSASHGGEAPRAVAINTVLADMDRAERQLGPDMSSAVEAEALQRDGRLLAVAGAGQVDDAAVAAIAATRRLISRVGDQSNLILDPDLDSYYSMSLVLLRFPELVDLLIQVRTKLDQMTGAGRISADDRTNFLLLEGRLTNVIHGIEGDRNAGYQGNVDGSLERALAPGFDSLDRALNRALAALRANVIDHDGSIDPASVDAAIADSLHSTQAVWGQTSAQLHRLLELRIDGFFRRMWEHFGLAGGLLFVILTLVLLVARRIAVPISRLAEVADRVRRTNDYNLRASWDSADEIGRLVDSFNTMLQRLQEEGARREELAAQTRAAAAQRDLIEAIPIPLTVTRQSDNALVHVNQPASVLLGVQSGSVQGEDFLSGHERTRLLDLLKLHGAVNEFETEIVARDGQRFWALMSARLLSYQGAPSLLTTITPITERKRMEEEFRAAKDRAEAALDQLRHAQQSLIQAEKMASLGGLVAGVAHEINTPIGIGLTGASTLAAETDKLRGLYASQAMTEEAFQDYLEVAGETARLLLTNMNRAAELIQSFKQVAVDQTSAERRSFDLANYIDEVLHSLLPTLKKTHHTLEVECPAGIELDSYPGILSQVLTNLVMNALIHAYDENQGGTLTIAVRTLADDKVELSFSDDGKGIPPENLTRIFDPFFTTRRAKGGSGLGLHVVFNVVTSSLSGQVAVTSEVGRGTTFILTFPRVAPKPAAMAQIEG